MNEYQVFAFIILPIRIHGTPGQRRTDSDTTLEAGRGGHFALT